MPNNPSTHRNPDALTEEEKTEIRAGIRRGLEAAAQGRERPIAEYAADVQKRRAARPNDPAVREASPATG